MGIFMSKRTVIANQSSDWFTIPLIFRPSELVLTSIRGIATSGFALFAMTCFFERLIRPRCFWQRGPSLYFSSHSGSLGMPPVSSVSRKVKLYTIYSGRLSCSI